MGVLNIGKQNCLVIFPYIRQMNLGLIVLLFLHALIYYGKSLRVKKTWKLAYSKKLDASSKHTLIIQVGAYCIALYLCQSLQGYTIINV